MSAKIVGDTDQASALQRLNHYQALGLTEAASSRVLSRGLWVERWPWHLLTEEDRRDATRRRIVAYSVLNDPGSRLAYDRELGFTRRRLAARIGEEDALWGNVWLAALVIAALWMFMAGPFHAARFIGGNLAPGFREEVVYHGPPPDCVPELERCSGYYAWEFRSTSDAWESILNGWIGAWFVWLVPSLVAITMGLAGRPLVNLSAGYAVAVVRYAGHRDTWTRALLVGIVLALVFGILAFWALSPPSPPPVPPGYD